MKLHVGSLFSGVGGLDLAVERVLGAKTLWQVETSTAARRVLARHWPDSDRAVTDVRAARSMASVDVVCGGFPCQDLSVAGSRAGLEGERSGLFFEMARVVMAVRPALVVLENVPGVEAYREDIEGALPGYGFRWVRWSATTAGAPHLRRRVLVVAVLGGRGSADLDITVSAKGWATPTGARLWPSTAATDFKSAAPGQRRGQLGEAVVESDGGRLNPSWVETLMGWPVGWTLPEGPSMRDLALASVDAPLWPRGRPPVDWAGPWAGYDWEPPRTELGPPVRGRPARLQACGNGVVPQAAAIALRAALTR